MQFYIFSIAHLAPAVQSNQLNGEIEGKRHQVGSVKNRHGEEFQNSKRTSRDVGAEMQKSGKQGRLRGLKNNGRQGKGSNKQALKPRSYASSKLCPATD